jgi:hypothetical protein
MSELQRNGVVETRNRRIVILDRAARGTGGPLRAGLSVDGQLQV